MLEIVHTTRKQIAESRVRELTFFYTPYKSTEEAMRQSPPEQGLLRDMFCSWCLPGINNVGDIAERKNAIRNGLTPTRATGISKRNRPQFERKKLLLPQVKNVSQVLVVLNVDRTQKSYLSVRNLALALDFFTCHFYRKFPCHGHFPFYHCMC